MKNISMLPTLMLATSPVTAFHAGPSMRIRYPPLIQQTVSLSGQRRYRSTTSGIAPLRSSTEDIGTSTEPVFEDVDGIGELTGGGAVGTSTNANTSLGETPTSSTTGATTQVSGVAGSSADDGSTEVMTAFPPFLEDPSGGGVLDNEILMAGTVIDPTSIVEDIIGNALSPDTDLNDILPPVDSNETDEVLDAEKKQLVDPSTVVEEIIVSALSDPEVNGQISTKDLWKEEQKVLQKKEEEDEMVEAPNLKRIIKFAIPAIGVWLCSPLLSLIDTSSVGLLSGTVQQAALNPAVAVTDYCALLVAFMYTATTNLVAGSQELEKRSKDKPRTSKTLIHALQLSGYVGVVLGFILSTFAPFLLRKIIGNDALDPAVFAAALRYVRIRAIGMPAAVIIGSAQSACIGMQDIKTPMYVLVAAALVNLMGDIMFVPSTSPWLGGAAGAALATVFSQYAALGLFIKWLTSRTKPEPTVNLTKAILELTGKSSEGRSRRMKFRRTLQKLSKRGNSNDDETANVPQPEPSPRPLSKMFKKKTEKTPDSSQEEFSARGFLADKFKMRDLMTFPPKKDAKEFWPYVVPVSTTSIGRVSAYVAMSHVVSSSLGTLSMAANQVILSVFYCLCPVADSLNLTAQSFIPGIFQKKKGPGRTRALKEATVNFLKAGTIFGAASVGVIGLIPYFTKFFTSDPLVITQVNSVVPLLAGIFALHGLVCTGEGLLLGQKDLGYIGRAYSVYFFAVPYFMLRLKKIALSGVTSVNLNSLWEVFLAYQVVRVAAWAVRLRVLNKRSTKEVPVTA